MCYKSLQFDISIKTIGELLNGFSSPQFDVLSLSWIKNSVLSSSLIIGGRFGLKAPVRKHKLVRLHRNISFFFFLFSLVDHPSSC